MKKFIALSLLCVVTLHAGKKVAAQKSSTRRFHSNNRKDVIKGINDWQRNKQLKEEKREKDQTT